MKDSYFVIFNRRGIDRFAKTESFSLKDAEWLLEMMSDDTEEFYPAECGLSEYWKLERSQISDLDAMLQNAFREWKQKHNLADYYSCDCGERVEFKVAQP